MSAFIMALLQIVALVVAELFEGIDNVVALVKESEVLPAEAKVPGGLRRIFHIGQRDGALRLGILLDCGWRICSFWLLSILVHIWPPVTIIVDLLGGFLLFESIRYFIQKADESEPDMQAARNNTRFWRVLLRTELLNVVFSVDSFATAWLVTHDILVLGVATFAGIAITRYGVKIARPIIQDRWHPIVTRSVYVLIGWVGVLLLIDIPLTHVFHIVVPEVAKFGLIFAILGPGIIWAEVSYRRRRRAEFTSHPEQRYSVRPNGPVYGGYVSGSGQVQGHRTWDPCSS